MSAVCAEKWNSESQPNGEDLGLPIGSSAALYWRSFTLGDAADGVRGDAVVAITVKRKG